VWEATLEIEMPAFSADCATIRGWVASDDSVSFKVINSRYPDGAYMVGTADGGVGNWRTMTQIPQNTQRNAATGGGFFTSGTNTLVLRIDNRLTCLMLAGFVDAFIDLSQGGTCGQPNPMPPPSPSPPPPPIPPSGAPLYPLPYPPMPPLQPCASAGVNAMFIIDITGNFNEITLFGERGVLARFASAVYVPGEHITYNYVSRPRRIPGTNVPGRGTLWRMEIAINLRAETDEADDMKAALFNVGTIAAMSELLIPMTVHSVTTPVYSPAPLNYPCPSMPPAPQIPPNNKCSFWCSESTCGMPECSGCTLVLCATTVATRARLGQCDASWCGSDIATCVNTACRGCTHCMETDASGNVVLDSAGNPRRIGVSPSPPPVPPTGMSLSPSPPPFPPQACAWWCVPPTTCGLLQCGTCSGCAREPEAPWGVRPGSMEI
jgi:hypothetical protein